MKPLSTTLCLLALCLAGPAAGPEDSSPFQRALALAERSLELGDLDRARDEIRRAQERSSASLRPAPSSPCPSRTA